MPYFPANQLKWVFILGLLWLSGPPCLEAQRHPESAGPRPYYRDDPEILGEPEWLHRPPFIRGPLDRYERGYMRMFLGASDAVPYLNYADDHYILYQREVIAWTQAAGRPWRTRNVRWDRLGNYMGPGYQRLFTWEEARSGVDHSGVSYIDHKEVGPLALRIGKYGYKSLNWTVTAGNDVRTRFTPLTLSLGHMEVARVDLDYRGQDQVTLLYNRGRSGFFSQWGLVPGDTYEESPVLMYGARWQRNIGDYARLGSTFLNQFMSFPSSPRSNGWRGDLPYEMLPPKIIRVFIADDSPQHGQANARVYGVDVVIDGERDGGRLRLSSNSEDADFDPRLQPTVTGGQLLPGGGRQAAGNEVVEYAFQIPPDVTLRAARFLADVAGDYRIGVRQTHDFLTLDRNNNPSLQEQFWPANFSASDAAKRQPFKWHLGAGEQMYYTVARSSGRSQGEGNRKIVSFDYGIPTGQTLAGLDWNADLVGLQLRGELVHNLQNFMFPVGDNDGGRHTKSAFAYWFKALKELGVGMQLGGEVYRLDPDYSGDYDSYRGGMAFHLDRQAAPGRQVESFTQEFGLVEDNDDNDQWPDEAVQEIIQAGELYPGWPNAGTYPGLDENSDNIADIDRNENFIPDWEEPFLMFYADPPEFVYGIDLNNNGVPDFRENDDKPDYPYSRDQQGYHLFMRANRLGRLGDHISLGYYRNRQLAGGGEAESLYLRYQLTLERSRMGRLRVNYDVKRVTDDIPDHTYVFVVPPNDVNVISWINTPDTPPDRAGMHRPATPDPLLMRDSWVHTVFVDARYTGFRRLQVHNSLLWTRNSQAEIELADGSDLLQPADVRSRFTMVNRVEYPWTRNRLEVFFRLKHRHIAGRCWYAQQSRTISASEEMATSEVIPIVMAQYNLTANTRFVAGAQGMPLLPYRYWDRNDKDGAFTQNDYLGMLTMSADYQGIPTSFFIGYKNTRRAYGRSKERNFKSGTLFMDIISAF